MSDLGLVEVFRTAWSGSPITTRSIVVLIAALFVTVVVIAATWILRWRHRRRDLKEIELELQGAVDRVDHRALYRSYGARDSRLEDALSEAGAKYRWFEAIVREVRDYHRRQMDGGDGGWGEVLDRYLDAPRRELAASRQSAGWVVLLGLAGTVVGFMEALPGLTEAFSVDAEGPAAGRVLPVLGGLGGVFLATFAGVVAAVALHMLLTIPQGSLAKFGNDLERFGARWLVPVMKAPENLLEQRLQEEVSNEFKRLGIQLEAILQPIVEKLTHALESLPRHVESFSSNIETGKEILDKFHGAVQTLGGSAQDAVESLSGVVTSSQEFIREIPRLQEEGRQEFLAVAGRLVEPVEKVEQATGRLTGAAEEMAQGVGDLKTSTAKLLTTSTRQEEHLSRLSDALPRLAESVPEQGERLNQVAGSLERLAAGQDELSSRLLALVTTAEAASQLDISEVAGEIQRSVREALDDLGARQDRLMQRIEDSLAAPPGASEQRQIEVLEQIHDDLAGMRRVVEQQEGTFDELRRHVQTMITRGMASDGHAPPPR